MYDERFARQYRYEPPSEFPLTSPYTSIVHHLSGPNACAHTYSFPNWEDSCKIKCSCIHIRLASGLINPFTRACVRLLGPCFKTGRVEAFRRVYYTFWHSVNTRNKFRAIHRRVVLVAVVQTHHERVISIWTWWIAWWAVACSTQSTEPEQYNLPQRMCLHSLSPQ